MRSPICVTVVIGAVMFTGAVCQAVEPAKASPGGACSLLTPQDLAKVVEGPASQPRSINIPYTKGTEHDHDGMMHTCGFSVGTHQVTVSFTTHEVTEEGRKAYETKTARWEQQIRERGARVDVKQDGGTRCVLIVATKGEKGAGEQQTSCTSTKGEYLVTVAVATPGAEAGVPISAVKALVDQAASRLP
ncbi:MAG: hypothetical protein ACM3O7_01450 [Acidobacteriota bacterium]